MPLKALAKILWNGGATWKTVYDTASAKAKSLDLKAAALRTIQRWVNTHEPGPTEPEVQPPQPEAIEYIGEGSVAFIESLLTLGTPTHRKYRTTLGPPASKKGQEMTQ